MGLMEPMACGKGRCKGSKIPTLSAPWEELWTLSGSVPSGAQPKGAGGAGGEAKTLGRPWEGGTEILVGEAADGAGGGIPGRSIPDRVTETLSQ